MVPLCSCGSLLRFCPKFLSFLEFTLKNLFAWAGSSFISWHATKEHFFLYFFFSLTSRPWWCGKVPILYEINDDVWHERKKENFRQSLFCQCQLWSFKFRYAKSNRLLTKHVVLQKILWYLFKWNSGEPTKFGPIFFKLHSYIKTEKNIYTT